jgi:hypothetical protein
VDEKAVAATVAALEEAERKEEAEAEAGRRAAEQATIEWKRVRLLGRRTTSSQDIGLRREGVVWQGMHFGP